MITILKGKTHHFNASENMKSFEKNYLKRLSISHSLLKTIRALGEYKGKEDLYKEQIPQALETLKQVAIIQSTESSNRIEGVTASLKRIQALINDKTDPRNRSEQEIAGYRDVLNIIHANYAYIPFTTNVVLQFHRDLYKYMGDVGGTWKSVDNVIEEAHPDGTTFVRFKPVPAFATSLYMGELHNYFNKLWDDAEIDKLILIPAYALDFLSIHPFKDGNGRMVRLLTLLLLYHAGIQVGRYISLEKIIEQSKESYYEALWLSSQGWHEGQHDVMPWIEYFLGVLLAAYKEFEERVGMLTVARGAKTEMILGAIKSLPNDFRMVELERLCPNVTRDMIRVVLKKLKKEGKIRCEGAGAGSCWKKRGNKS